MVWKLVGKNELKRTDFFLKMGEGGTQSFIY